MESESAIQGLRGELDFPWTITFPIQAGIIKLLPGITVAATPDSPASRANRTTLLPRSFNRTLHLSLRTLSSTWTSVASPQCHGGTVTTSVAPTGTVTEGIGDMSLRVMDGEPGGAEHGGEVEVVGAEMEVVGTVRSARLDDGELREEPTAAAATSTTRTTMASQGVALTAPHTGCRRSWSGQPGPSATHRALSARLPHTKLDAQMGWSVPLERLTVRSVVEDGTQSIPRGLGRLPPLEGGPAAARHGHMRQCSMSTATMGPGGGVARYCSYLAARSPRARSRSSPSSSTRPDPSTRTHHRVAQSSS